jgi:tellurite resistance protein TerC
LLAAIPVLIFVGKEQAINYTTVYLIERSLSLDNLFVFLMLFAYFSVPTHLRGKLVLWGIVFALILRGLAIAGGTVLLGQFHVLIYILALGLLALAYKIFRGVGENIDVDKNLAVRLVRKFFPVSSEYHENKWFVPGAAARENHSTRRHVTPLFVCLAAIVFADIAFAIDSIPAAFAITQDAFVIWMGNVFALLGLRALFVLVESLVERFRYLDESIAIVLAVIGIKILIEEWVHISPVLSLVLVAAIFAGGIIVSVLADRKEAQRGAEGTQRVGPDQPTQPIHQNRDSEHPPSRATPEYHEVSQDNHHGENSQTGRPDSGHS